MNLNKVILAGNLTRSPELRYIPSGVAVTMFDMATSRAWVGEHGERKEETEFHHLVVFGKLAETTTEYLSRGSLALVEGRVRTRSWEQDGIKRYRTEIIAERIQFGPKRQEEIHADGPADDTVQIDGTDDAPF
jgi:single-strand DNA-binding protein